MASTRIYRTMGQNGNSGKLTISVWLKRHSLGEKNITTSYYSGAYHGNFYFNPSDQLSFYDYRNGYLMQKVTTRKFRDTNAWYHIVANFDHTISSPTAQLWVNGEEITDFATDNDYSQGDSSSWLTDYTHIIGAYNTSYYHDGLMADYYFIQGYKYDASTFGETDSTSGIWKPKTSPTINYGGTGGNSCHLKFENSSNMDLDSGSNNISFTTTGTLTQTEDSPSNNFATFNPIKDGRMYSGTQYKATFSNGNTTSTFSESVFNTGAFSSLAVMGGKWYAEIKCSNKGGDCRLGLFSADDYGNDDFAQTYLYDSSGTYGGSAYGNTFTTGDIIQIAFDSTNGNLWFGKNGTWQNSATQSEIEAGTTTNAAATGLSTTQFWNFGTYGVNATAFQANFGNGRFGTTALASSNSDSAGLGLFEYSVPSGYYALCTKNIKNYG